MSGLDSLPFGSGITPERDADYAYRMGQDCARNGANTTNCHFSIFATPENTRAWERGKRDAEAAASGDTGKEG